ncbi:SGNH/GDSL hydrolase family protein [Edaphobacter albus]|uniref:SGNH/GDSL hydrolase family protein n=1 Tax=Edaphobacter sp. 4G125 TaxID=2763071 RepID=UPI001648C8BF|nr:SGNH/GDSL hydrolase family protein [Edaphobacter sp. 4G125]QNI35238.1 SGNH/GDSL hydrolase family protein [Edaphobacter sp. 4G125]
MKRVLLLGWMALALVSAGVAQARRNVTEKIEWTYTDRPEMPDSKLPNVLLVGDSITRAYYKATADSLSGKANVYYFAASTSVGDERLAPQLAEYFRMIKVRFDVVHFNNGMHGWGYTEDEYRRYFPELVAAVRTGAPGARLVWASTTPVRKDQQDGATNARIDARNAIALEQIKKDGIPVDDQHALMMRHQDLHSDDVHFTTEGSAIQGTQVAESVLKVLPKKTSVQ